MEPDRDGCRCGSEEAKQKKVEMQKISILNLNYRQGPDVPQLKTASTIPTSSVSLTKHAAPASTQQAGTPTDGYATGDRGRNRAALKAIQAVENASLGRAAHPRVGDLSFPVARLEGCTQCKRCTVECPFGAIDEDERRFPYSTKAVAAAAAPAWVLPGARDFVRELFGGHRWHAGQSRGYAG